MQEIRIYDQPVYTDLKNSTDSLLESTRPDINQYDDRDNNGCDHLIRCSLICAIFVMSILVFIMFYTIFGMPIA
jgi:hypothetical protein